MEDAEDKATAEDAQDDEALYSGRWTREEEEYAQCLMKEFRAGNIPDLENGATLRNYIAKMLSCPPKRITKKYERTAYNGKLTYCANLVAMGEEEAQRRRDTLEDQRKKFLASRKQRLMGKPYQKPRPKADITRKMRAEAKESDLGTPRGPSIGLTRPAAGLMADSALGATLLGQASAGSMSPGRLDTSLLQASAAGLGALPYASLPGSSLLGGNPLLNVGLREQLLLNSNVASLQASLGNPLLMGQRSMLLGRPVGAGLLPSSNPLLSQNLARQHLIAEIQRENDRNTMLQQALATQIGANVVAQAQPEEGASQDDLANQLRAQAQAGQKRPRTDDEPPSPGKRRRDP